MANLMPRYTNIQIHRDLVKLLKQKQHFCSSSVSIWLQQLMKYLIKVGVIRSQRKNLAQSL